MDKYTRYTVEDFLDDDDFIRYVKYREMEELRRWEDWLSTNPPAAAGFHEAESCLLAMLSVRPVTAPPTLQGQTWEVVESRLRVLDKRRIISRYIRASVVAAVVAGILLIAGNWYFNGRVTVTTGYAQQQRVELPDHSMVVLNANSSLSWYRAWSWRGTREVWLKGEALFDVGHPTAEGDSRSVFTAHAGALAVRVLGTSFNIRQRRSTVEISLFSGKVSIVQDSPAGAVLILQPGEAAAFQEAATAIVKLKAPTSEPRAWISHRIRARGMTVQDIIEHYEDTYGNHIVLEDTAQASRTIDGTLSLETEEGVVYMLANILNDNIHQEGRIIYLRPK